MLSPWSVLNLEVILLEDLQPPCHLTLWLAEVQHPGEASVLGPQFELGAQEVGPEMTNRQDRR